MDKMGIIILGLLIVATLVAHVVILDNTLENLRTQGEIDE